MNDVSKDFGSSGAVPQASSYGHPLTQQILEETRELLSKIPEGRRLLEVAKDNNYKIEVISGKEPDFRYGSEDTAFLICPMNTKAVDLEAMACNLGLAIYELEQPSLGIPRGSYDPAMRHILFNQMLDITIKMCQIVGEFEDLGKGSKLIDLLGRLGHSQLYKGFRSGQSKEELTKIYSVSVNAV